MPYPGHSLRQWSYSSAEKQSVYSTAHSRLGPVGRILPFCRDAVGVFNSAQPIGACWENLTLLQRSSRYIQQPTADWGLLGESYPSAEMQSVYSTAPSRLGLVGRILPFCRDAVGVFYSPQPIGACWENLTLLQRSSRCIQQPTADWGLLGESYPSAEMQSVYSTAPADRAIF